MAKTTPITDPEIVDGDHAVDEMLRAAEKNPDVITRLMHRLKSSPVLSKVAGRNMRGIKLGVEHRVGRAIMVRVRDGIIRPVLPEAYQPALDHKLVAGGVDVGMALLFNFAYEMYGEKLPEKMQEYAELLVDSVTYASWSDVFGAFDLEGMFTKLLTGDIMSMLDELKAQRAKDATA